MRTIRPAKTGSYAGRIMLTNGSAETDAPTSLYNPVQGDSKSMRNLFIVQSVSNSEGQQLKWAQDRG